MKRKVFTVEPPFKSQNDAPIDNKKWYIDPSRLLRMSVMVSVAVSQVVLLNWYLSTLGWRWMASITTYYCDVLLSKHMLPAIKHVAERCLFTKQYVACGENGHFLCSVIYQGKVVALDRWGGKWNRPSMTHRLFTNYVKNYCNRTFIVKVIVENVVTCFFGTQCISEYERKKVSK